MAWSTNKRMRAARCHSLSPTSPSKERHSDRGRFVTYDLGFKMAEPAWFLSLAAHHDSASTCEDISRVVFEMFQSRDGRHHPGGVPDTATIGLRRGFDCADVVSVLRGVVENGLTCEAKAIARSMSRRQAQFVAAFISEIRSSALIVGHIGWHTAPLSPTVGLRLGCSVSPMFGWDMEDMFSDVREESSRRECGVFVVRERLLNACWADDAWIFVNPAEEFICMLRRLEQAAASQGDEAPMQATNTHLELRLPKCQWTRIQKQGQDFEELGPMPQCANLLEIQEMRA